MSPTFSLRSFFIPTPNTIDSNLVFNGLFILCFGFLFYRVYELVQKEINFLDYLKDDQMRNLLFDYPASYDKMKELLSKARFTFSLSVSKKVKEELEADIQKIPDEAVTTVALAALQTQFDYNRMKWFFILFYFIFCLLAANYIVRLSIFVGFKLVLFISLLASVIIIIKKQQTVGNL